MHRAAPLLLVVLLALAGCSGPLSDASPGNGSTGDVDLVEQWTAGESTIEGNHHAAAAGRVDGEAVVAVPLGGHHGETGCRLLVLDGAGERRWSADVPRDACTIHAVADPALADFVGDDQPELLAATTEEAVVAYDPLTGDVQFRHDLARYGYTAPVVADVVDDDRAELVVTDVGGTISVVRADGTTAWRRSLGAYSWAPPAVADFDGSGGREIVLGLGNGTAVAFASNGDASWTASVNGSVTWSAHGDVDDDPAREFLVASTEGTVAAIDGGNGSVEWSRSLSAYAAVGPPLDGDGDGSLEVYATDRSGRLYALAGATGETVWTTRLTDAEVQMTPPPRVGDVTGDGSPDLVAVTNDGRVAVVNPGSGDLRGSYRRNASLYTHATLADTDGDGTEEVYVVYGDGRAVALSVQGSTSS